MAFIIRHLGCHSDSLLYHPFPKKQAKQVLSILPQWVKEEEIPAHTALQTQIFDPSDSKVEDNCLPKTKSWREFALMFGTKQDEGKETLKPLSVFLSLHPKQNVSKIFNLSSYLWHLGKILKPLCLPLPLENYYYATKNCLKMV